MDSRVRLSGLTASELNGAEGVVVAPFDPATGRYSVKLHSPRSAVNKYKAGVKVQRKHLEDLSQGPPPMPVGGWAESTPK